MLGIKIPGVATRSCGAEAMVEREMYEQEGNPRKLCRGASLRGQGTPADPARLRSVRARNPENFLSGSQTQSQQWTRPIIGQRVVRGAGRVTPRRSTGIYLSSSPRRNSYRSIAATTPTAPSSRGSVRCTRPRQRTRTARAHISRFRAGFADSRSGRPANR